MVSRTSINQSINQSTRSNRDTMGTNKAMLIQTCLKFTLTQTDLEISSTLSLIVVDEQNSMNILSL